jgi:hypothetical protein
MANYVDPWLAGIWKVYVGAGEGGPYLKPKDREGCFKLAAVPDPVDGDTAYYRVDFASCDMPDSWRIARFFPRGNVMASPPNPQLPIWTEDPANRLLWEVAATSVRKAMKPGIKRLECDVRPLGDAETLILVPVYNAVVDNSSLLVLMLTSSRWNYTDEDGTAHGGGPH